MSRELHWSLVVTKNAHLDGEGKITIERTSIQRLVKQAFDAGAEAAAINRCAECMRKEPNSAAVNELKKAFGWK